MPRDPRPTLQHPQMSDVSLAGLFGALSDPTRMRIVRTLMDEPLGRACGTFAVGVSPSTLSHHFKVLRAAGLIHQEERGKRRWTVLRREELETHFPGLLGVLVNADGSARDVETHEV